jgi:hypothetical protein
MLSKLFRVSRVGLGLLGLAVAAVTLFAVTEQAEAIKGKSAKTRALFKLKKPQVTKVNPNIPDPYPNLTKFGITGKDYVPPPGQDMSGGCFVLAIWFNKAADGWGDHTDPVNKPFLEKKDIIIQVEDQAVASASQANDLIGQAYTNNQQDVWVVAIDATSGQPTGALFPLNPPSTPNLSKMKAKKAKN